MKWTRPILNKTAASYMNVADIEYVYLSLDMGASIAIPADLESMVTTNFSNAIIADI